MLIRVCLGALGVFLWLFFGFQTLLVSVKLHAISTNDIPEATFSLILHEFPLAARWQVLHAPDKNSSKEMHIENRPRPVAQWEHGGSFILPRVAMRHALLVCTRSLSVDFSGGSSFPGYQGIRLISGRARNLSKGSCRALRRPADVRLSSRPISPLGSRAAAKGGSLVLLRAYSGISLLTTINSSLSKLDGILLLVGLFGRWRRIVERGKERRQSRGIATNQVRSQRSEACEFLYFTSRNNG